ncbi:MAG: sodium:proton antiporter, partial [Limisphaerales bacterium]
MIVRFLVIILALLAGVIFWQATVSLPREGNGLTMQVVEAMPMSGVEHPVTAVLLNFRSYDTWLELG